MATLGVLGGVTAGATGLVSSGLGLAGAATSYAASQETGQAQSDAALYSAEVARNNAKVAAENARYANEAGEAQGEAYSLKGAQNLGAVRAGQAASGVNVNTGSAVKVQQSQAEVDALNTANVVNNANMQAWGYRQQAYSYREQAGLDTQEAGYAREGADITGLGSLLSNASTIGFKFGSLGGLGTSSTGSSTTTGGT